MTILSVRHVTTYRYSRPVAFGEHRMMFRPRDSYDQKLHRGRGSRSRPSRRSFRWIHDVFGNCVAIAELRRAGARAALREPDPARPHAGRRPRLPDRGLRQDLPVLLRARTSCRISCPRSSGAIPIPSGSSSAGCASSCAKGARPTTGELLMTLTYAIKEGFAYERRSERGTHAPLHDAEARPRQLPRPRAADDGSGALPRLRRPLRLGLHLRARPRRRDAISAAARRTPGARSICPAPAGSSSTRPTASSATAT